MRDNNYNVFALDGDRGIQADGDAEATRLAPIDCPDLFAVTTEEEETLIIQVFYRILMGAHNEKRPSMLKAAITAERVDRDIAPAIKAVEDFHNVDEKK